MLQIVIHDPNVGVGHMKDAEGNEFAILRLQDPHSAIVVELPLTAEAKRQLISALEGKQPIQIASSMNGIIAP